MTETDKIPPLVIFSPGRLGDVVCVEPVYRTLHERHPGRPVWMFCRKPYYDALRFTPYVDRCTTFGDVREIEKLKSALPEGSIVYVL